MLILLPSKSCRDCAPIDYRLISNQFGITSGGLLPPAAKAGHRIEGALLVKTGIVPARLATSRCGGSVGSLMVVVIRAGCLGGHFLGEPQTAKELSQIQFTRRDEPALQ